MNDPVNRPSHYELFPDGTQAIDVIRAALTPEEFIGYCKGNALKYRLRAGKKDALQQDIDKAETYVAMMNPPAMVPTCGSIPVELYDNCTPGPIVPHIVTGMHKSEWARPPQQTAKEYCGPFADCDKCPEPCTNCEPLF